MVKFIWIVIMFFFRLLGKLIIYGLNVKPLQWDLKLIRRYKGREFRHVNGKNLKVAVENQYYLVYLNYY